MGDDIRRTCTCALVRWDGTDRPTPKRIVSYDPARRTEDDAEVTIVNVHNFDGSPCFFE